MMYSPVGSMSAAASADAQTEHDFLYSVGGEEVARGAPPKLQLPRPGLSHLLLLVAVWYAASTAATFFLQAMVLYGHPSSSDSPPAAAAAPAWLLPALIAQVLQASSSLLFESIAL